MEFKKIGINTRNWVDLAQDKIWRVLVNATLNLRVSKAMELVTSTGNRPLGRPSCRWEDNIRMEFKGIGINTRNWVYSAQDRDYWGAIVNAVLNIQVP